VSEPLDLVLASVRTAEGRAVHVGLAGGAVATVLDASEPVPAGTTVRHLDGWTVLPAAAEPHAHLDKTLTGGSDANASGDLDGALRAWEECRLRFDHDDGVARALEGIARAVAGGVTAMRTHVDLREPLGLAPLAAVVEARDRAAAVCRVEIAGLLLDPATGPQGAEGRSLLVAALDAGVDVVGGCPLLDPDPSGCVRELVAIAAAHDRMIDLHVDETLDPDATTLHDLADRVAATDLGGRAVGSHAVSLGVRPVDVQREVAARLADVGVGVVTLPHTNLLLQGRGQRTSTPRGLTALASLDEAGVVVAAGGDNVADPFNPLGRSDPFETAGLLVAGGHLTPARAWSAVSADARTLMGLAAAGVDVGDAGDLLVVRSGSLVDAIATAPGDRIVIHAGRVVAESRTEQVVDPRALAGAAG
jgi:cytosine deaminase